MALTAELIQVTDTQYHAHEFSRIPHYSNSIGKKILTKSPQHAWLDHPILNPLYEGEDDEAKFSVGTVAHAALLQGINVCEPLDFKDYRTNDAKAARDSAYLAGKIPMLANQFERVLAMVSSAKSQMECNKELDHFKLSNYAAEQTIILTKDETKIKMRLDLLRNDGGLIIDYKTTDVMSPAQWMKSISDMGADMQCALYKEGARVLTGKVPRFVFAIQEVKPPFMMYFIELTGAYAEYGESRTNRAIAIWEGCMASGQWPGYDQRLMSPDLPPWVEGQWLEKELMIDADDKQHPKTIDVAAGAVSREAFLFGKVK